MKMRLKCTMTNLHKCLFSRTRTRELAEQAVQYISNLPQDMRHFNHLIRGLVHFPDLLLKYFELEVKIISSDLAFMFARCCELGRKNFLS
jgi:hypothetical protein